MRQYDKQHAVTIIAAAALAAYRFVAFNGGYATSAGEAYDSAGVSEHAAAVGEAVSVTTGYSYLVEAAEPIDAGEYVKPGVDGRAAVGAHDDCCAQALASVGAGQLVEVRILAHRHPGA